MNNSKVFASVSGVCIASAVVIGSVLAVANHHDSTPPATPVGHAVVPTATVTATVTARPTPVVAVKLSPSTQAVAPKVKPKRQTVVVQRQEVPAVTDPTSTPADLTTSTEAPSPAQQRQVDDPGSTYTPSPNPEGPALPNPNRPGGKYPHPTPSS